MATAKTTTTKAKKEDKKLEAQLTWDEVLVTESWFQKLKDELESLKWNKRREVASRLKEAISYWDLSENSEYSEAKEEQAFVEWRIIELEQKIKKAKIISDQHTGEAWIWSDVEIENLETKKKEKIISDFVFIGAGGGAIPLLEKADIPEAKGFGGFPISGQWLKCNNPEVIKQHEAKVYGLADVGSPPMSVPHLDTRIMKGKKALLFGPYAGFSTKFLKYGSYTDLPLSLEAHNVWPMLQAGWKNLGLTKYLVKQVFQSMDDRFELLQKYLPEAVKDDWELVIAGQRVQIIKDDDKEGGVLQFGTEIVTDKELTLTALLGASPGASTSVSIMLDVIQKCFPEQINSKDWHAKIKKMIPSYGESLIDNGQLLRTVRNRTTQILKLEE